jgi:hypothetical protein
MVEHRFEKPGVVGSIPTPAANHEECLKEYIAFQAGHVGSNPTPRSNLCGDRLVVRTPYVPLSNSCLRDHQNVAQFGSALARGARGRRFESAHSDYGQ